MDYLNNNILVVGFGSIGRRHVQSLLDVGFKNIHILDSDYSRISTNLKVIGYSKENVNILDDIDQINFMLDLAIISTSAFPRYQIVQNLISKGVKNYLLEKIVFQSTQQFKNVISSLSAIDGKAYCNFPNRYITNYMEIRSVLAEMKTNSTLSMSVRGGDIGIACSGVHYLDLFEYLTNSQIAGCSSSLNQCDEVNKRGSEYLDFSGVLYAHNMRGDSVDIYFDNSHHGNVSISLQFNNKNFILSEGDSIAYSIHDFEIQKENFKVIPSSSLTACLVNDIFRNQTSLSTIQETANVHSFLFKECLNEINEVYTEAAICPIT